MHNEDAASAIDLNEARTFIAALTGTGSDAAVTFQTFPDSKDGDKSLIRVRHGSLAEHADELVRLNARGAGVFITINETNLRGRTKDDITAVRALYVDFDDIAAKPFDVIKTLKPDPHIVVESSPGKAHVYWRVAGCAVDDFKGFQQSLIDQLKSDSQVKSAEHVMRLPGFIHQKDRAKPFRTRIKDTNDTLAYTTGEVMAGVLPARAASAPTKPPKAARANKLHGGAEFSKIKSALQALPTAEWDERLFWLDVGMSLHSYGTETGTDDECFRLWCEASRVSKKFDEANSRSRWASFSAEKKSGKTIATLYFMAQQHGWKMPRAGNLRAESDGLFYDGVDKAGEPFELKVCDPLRIVAEARDTSGTNWTHVLEFVDRDGGEQTWLMPLGMLAGEAIEVRAELMNRGLWVASEKIAKDQLTKFLHGGRNLPRATYVDSPGWHGAAYVLPHRTIGATSHPVLYRGSGTPSRFAHKGTATDWRNKVAALAAGNSRLMFAICTAFAAPLLHVVGADAGGFHLVGDSSLGKTSIVRAAASVWGGEHYIRSWRATTNGLEGVAAEHNDGLLVLDELNQVDAREAGENAYMLANGRGKARANKTGAARSIAQWQLLYLSTGETGLSAHMSKIGQRAEAGQEVRLVEIPADAGAGLGIYETLNGRADGATLSNELASAALAFHGVAGLEFLEHVTSRYAEVRAQAKALFKDYTAALVPDGAEGQARRVAERFALVAAAGDIATQHGLTGWTADAPLRAAQLCFNAWLERRGGPANAERRAILQQVRQFFELNGQSRFQPLNDASFDRIIQNRAGFREHDEDGAIYYVLATPFASDLCKGCEPRKVAKLLAAEGWIVPDKTAGKNSQSIKLGDLGQTRCYVFTRKALQAEID